ncbi:MAG TPA: hypothetical protein VK756_02585 [Solirubrobacteraceae bacterium]|nr:hypothetical protein [Solirubrobacteraceae bacterium]
MSDPLQPQDPQENGGDTEEVDAVVVVPEQPVLSATRQTRAIVPTVQAAAVAATGFVAGAAAAGLVRRRRHRRDLVRAGSRRRMVAARRGRGGRGGAGELIQIVGSRSLLVDVHLLGVPGRDR